MTKGWFLDLVKKGLSDSQKRYLTEREKVWLAEADKKARPTKVQSYEEKLAETAKQLGLTLAQYKELSIKEKN